MLTKQLYKLKNICLNCFKILMLRAFLHRAVSTIEWHDVPIFAGKTLALSGLYKWQNKCYKDEKILANHLSSISTFANWFVVKKIICLSVLFFLLTHLKNKKKSGYSAISAWNYDLGAPMAKLAWVTCITSYSQLQHLPSSLRYFRCLRQTQQGHFLQLSLEAHHHHQRNFAANKIWGLKATINDWSRNIEKVLKRSL